MIPCRDWKKKVSIRLDRLGPKNTALPARQQLCRACFVCQLIPNVASQTVVARRSSRTPLQCQDHLFNTSEFITASQVERRDVALEQKPSRKRRKRSPATTWPEPPPSRKKPATDPPQTSSRPCKRSREPDRSDSGPTSSEDESSESEDDDELSQAKDQLIEEIEELGLVPYRAVLDKRLAGLLQDELEAFNKQDLEDFDEPKTAQEMAQMAELTGGDKVDEKSTRAFRKCIHYARKTVAFFALPKQQLKTKLLLRAGKLNADDPRVKVAAILGGIKPGLWLSPCCRCCCG